MLFDESLIRTRSAVERAYGFWKRRFPALAMGKHICNTLCYSYLDYSTQYCLR
nr:unnamed protein product [Callosobruchus analis]